MKGTAYKFAEIRKARQRSDIEVKTLARAAQVSTMTWWRLENGRAASLGLIIRACELLALDWREMIVASKAKTA